MLCKHCDKETKIPRKGYCAACYGRILRWGSPVYSPSSQRDVKECKFCHKADGPFVKGLCKACYYREKKQGDLEYRRAIKFCTVPGCKNEHNANGLCGKHLMRVKKTGSIDDPVLITRGPRTQHPLYEAHSSMLRGSRMNGGYDPRWKDFWAFLDDMGEKPSSRHRLLRINVSLPFSKTNCEWRVSVLDEPMIKGDQLSRAAYMRAYNLKNPDVLKRTYLKRYYGIALEEYQLRVEVQGGVCAICKCSETRMHSVKGMTMSLAVDHDHNTGAIRGLLCANCNHMLGNAKDSAALLRLAADYLDRHNGAGLRCEG